MKRPRFTQAQIMGAACDWRGPEGHALTVAAGWRWRGSVKAARAGATVVPVRRSSSANTAAAGRHRDQSQADPAALPRGEAGGTAAAPGWRGADAIQGQLAHRGYAPVGWAAGSLAGPGAALGLAAGLGRAGSSRAVLSITSSARSAMA